MSDDAATDAAEQVLARLYMDAADIPAITVTARAAVEAARPIIEAEVWAKVIGDLRAEAAADLNLTYPRQVEGWLTARIPRGAADNGEPE